MLALHLVKLALSEEKRDAVSSSTWILPGVPAYRLVNSCRQGRYRIEKEILTDPRRDVTRTFSPS